jgi:hypothetical protein
VIRRIRPGAGKDKEKGKENESMIAEKGKAIPGVEVSLIVVGVAPMK